MKPKIYLDTCSIQRPLDSKNQLRIALEAEAVLGILSLVEVNEIELVSSEMLLFEINRNSNRIRKEYALEVTSKARHFSNVTAKMEIRSREFNKLGIQPFDSVHLASAEGAHADYFCTCDDELMKKAKKIKDLKMKVVSPLELVKEILK
jgi:predicted nucleic acid-binding protein